MIKLHKMENKKKKPIKVKKLVEKCNKAAFATVD